MPSIVFGREKKDSLILDRVYTFYETHPVLADTLNDNLYTKFRFNVERRNPILWLIPNMYVMAKNEKEYIRESYSNINFYPNHDYDINRQVLSSTISRNRNAIRPLRNLLMPTLYHAKLYKVNILSPFSRYNRRYYRYRETPRDDGTTRLSFHPKVYNTQLLNGYAIVENETGRIRRTVLNGEFEMINFRTEIQMGTDSCMDMSPLRCTTAACFKFAGNRISALIDAVYQNKQGINDSIDEIDSREMMDSLRPVPLSETDRQIYAAYDKRHEPDSNTVETTPSRWNVLKKIFWDTIGDNLITPISAESGPAQFRLSPILDPLSLRWSHSRGLSYKLRLRSRYTFSPHRYLTLDPTFGYNFKIKKFYFDAPLRMTYNPKRNGYAEIVIGSGNRIKNGSVAESIYYATQDSAIFEVPDIDKFDDNYMRVFNNIMLFDWLDIEAGFVFHRYKAVAKEMLESFDRPTVYRTAAPMIGLKISPWRNGPLFSIDWEKSFKGDETNIDYERIEIDASWKYSRPNLQIFNFRLGGGFYTRKHQDYFVDFSNFRDNNLPEGWEDKWSGSFELLSNRLYNESPYYIRANASYDSPMMLGSRVPYLGKYIVRERFYLSSAFVAHTRPYYELGYSFTNRYVSIGLFASFHNAQFQRVGIDFEFELFRRW